MASVYLHLKVEMDYKDAKDEAPVADFTKDTIWAYPVNNFLHSLFKQVTLTLNGKMVAQNSQNYAYRYNKTYIHHFAPFPFSIYTFPFFCLRLIVQLIINSCLSHIFT